MASVENFRNWKFYLILLQTLCSGNNEKAGPYVRSKSIDFNCTKFHSYLNPLKQLFSEHLKAHLKQLATLPCKRSMMNLLLTARASNAVTMDISKNLDLYADWYKNNIGEMKFFFKAEEFHNIMNLLDQCIAYEAELDYLEVVTYLSLKLF